MLKEKKNAFMSRNSFDPYKSQKSYFYQLYCFKNQINFYIGVQYKIEIKIFKFKNLRTFHNYIINTCMYVCTVDSKNLSTPIYFDKKKFPQA